VKDGLPVLLN
jgi:pulA_typeI: pullulanase, type I